MHAGDAVRARNRGGAHAARSCGSGGAVLHCAHVRDAVQGVLGQQGGDLSPGWPVGRCNACALQSRQERCSAGNAWWRALRSGRNESCSACCARCSAHAAGGMRPTTTYGPLQQGGRKQLKLPHAGRTLVVRCDSACSRPKGVAAAVVLSLPRDRSCRWHGWTLPLKRTRRACQWLPECGADAEPITAVAGLLLSTGSSLLTTPQGLRAGG